VAPVRLLLVSTTANGPGGTGTGVAVGECLIVARAEVVGRAELVGVGAGDGAHAPSAVPATIRQQAVEAALWSIGRLPFVSL
jgi:hypothetical protein